MPNIQGTIYTDLEEAKKAADIQATYYKERVWWVGIRQELGEQKFIVSIDLFSGRGRGLNSIPPKGWFIRAARWGENLVWTDISEVLRL